jgi:hypothetical protein
MKGICGRCAMDMGKVSTHEQEGKHYWNHGNCKECHYLGFYDSIRIKYSKLDVY